MRRMASSTRADQAGNEPAKMRVTAGREGNQTFDVPNERTDPKTFERKLRLGAGEVRVAVEFINDFYDPKHKNPNRRDRNLLVEWVELDGPAEYQGPLLRFGFLCFGS